mmetsp:Transcript_26683/g.32886  ORF Transcript_26683/g.32886 Transcript_26683/m.32886 type:complete len:225 (+) Transcript_26683:400-1074(+)
MSAISAATPPLSPPNIRFIAICCLLRFSSADSTNLSNFTNSFFTASFSRPTASSTSSTILVLLSLLQLESSKSKAFCKSALALLYIPSNIRLFPLRKYTFGLFEPALISKAKSQNEQVFLYIPNFSVHADRLSNTGNLISCSVFSTHSISVLNTFLFCSFPSSCPLLLLSLSIATRHVRYTSIACLNCFFWNKLFPCLRCSLAHCIFSLGDNLDTISAACFNLD